MGEKRTIGKKLFISYSWTSQEHEEWVIKLAERLMQDGVEVILDKWELKEGQDKYKFMEKMIKDPAISNVLVICDKGYKDKADSREGGVGDETIIITPEVYKDAEQRKFIPIIAEKGESFDEYIPIYMKTRIGIDMSSPEAYETGYEKLLRLIYEQPEYRKPALGEPPSYLFEPEKGQFKTTNINKGLKNALLSKPEQVNYYMNDFLKEFKNSLKQLKISDEVFVEAEIKDQLIYDTVMDMKPLRDDYIEFLTLLSELKPDFNINNIIKLFEEIYSFTEFQGNGIINDIKFDYYKFFIYELFLYTMAILLKNELYEKMNTLLKTVYYIDKYGYEQTKGRTFDVFRFYLYSFERDRNKRLELRRHSVTADIMMSRTVVGGEDYKKYILDADLLMFYISLIQSEEIKWFPITFIYSRYNRVEILNKMTRTSVFNNVKILFNVNTIDDFKKLLEKYKESYRGYSFESIPSLASQVDIENLGKYL